MNIKEYANVTPEIFANDIFPLYEPAVLKGTFEHWPLLKKSRQSLGDLLAYLLEYDAGSAVEVFVTPAEEKGKLFYNNDYRSFNFSKFTISFEECLTRICMCLAESSPPSIYMGSTPAEKCLPGLMANNGCALLSQDVKPRLWIGNESIVQPHFDVSDNIAVVVSGRRRFTLFPPEQIDNLYIGPMDITPAGQPMSLVSLTNPDLEKYPRYSTALESALVAELEPGDAIFIPSLWWHGVQGLDKFNFLVNYWWCNSGVGADTPHEAMIHSLLTISHLPIAERKAWRFFFDHYVFQLEKHPLAHIDENAHGVLGQMTPEIYQVIRKYLLSRMP